MDNMPENWDESQLALGASFLQSSGWAEFQRALGKKCHFVSRPGWSCLLIERTTPMGNYLFAPYGPTLASASAIEQSLHTLKELGKRIGVTWLRLEPISKNVPADELKTRLAKLGAVPAVHFVDPPVTRLVDLSLPTDQLLASISQTTRNIIRKNQRDQELTFTTSTNPADIAMFTPMVNSVKDRNKVIFFPDSYYNLQAQVLMPKGAMRLELAFLGGKPVAGLLMHDFGTTATYTHAASLPEAREKSASALLLWQAIVNAQARGIKTLDLFGVAPDGASPKHPWHGISEFKKKFGGQLVEHAGAWDLPLARQYKLYRLANKTRFSLRRR